MTGLRIPTLLRSSSTNGTHHMMIQGRDGTGLSGTYVPVDYEGLRFLQVQPIDFKDGQKK
jgi:hypothetical protein